MEPHVPTHPHESDDGNTHASEENTRYSTFTIGLLVCLCVLVLTLSYLGIRLYVDYQTVTYEMEQASELASTKQYGMALQRLEELEENGVWIASWVESEYQILKDSVTLNKNANDTYLSAKDVAKKSPEQAVVLLETIPDAYADYSEVVALRDTLQLKIEQIEQAREKEIRIIDHIQGNPEAEVKLVVYSDFQCPACAAFVPHVDEIIEEYANDITFQYKHFPLRNIHPLAQSAALAAEAAGQQGKFFEYHDVLFTHQREWSQLDNPESQFVQYAEELELDTILFQQQMHSTTLGKKIESEFDEARNRNVTGTPTVFLNGEKMRIRSYEDFATGIAHEVAQNESP